jgi:uncharacterized protein with PQ loop repeat
MNFLINITGWLNMILFSIVVVPQIIKTIKTKKIDGVSIGVYFLLVIANIDAFVYATLIQQIPLQVKYIFGLLTSLLYIFIYFKHKRS